MLEGSDTNKPLLKQQAINSTVKTLWSMNWIFPIHIECFHVTSSPWKTENSRHVGVQRDRSFYGDLHEMSDILIMLLICVELDKMSLLHKLIKQLHKRLPVFFD